MAVQAQKNEIAVQLGREQAIHEELLSQRRHHQIEIGKLRNPGRLVELARGRLGMTPQPAGFRVLSPPGARDRGTPAAALKRTARKEAP